MNINGRATTNQMGLILKRDHINIAIAHSPKHQHLKSRPDQHATDQRIKHIIQKLIIK